MVQNIIWNLLSVRPSFYHLSVSLACAFLSALHCPRLVPRLDDKLWLARWLFSKESRCATLLSIVKWDRAAQRNVYSPSMEGGLPLRSSYPQRLPFPSGLIQYGRYSIPLPMGSTLGQAPFIKAAPLRRIAGARGGTEEREFSLKRSASLIHGIIQLSRTQMIAYT